MENKMKVGEYVRTKDGYIVQVVNINDFREPSMKYGVEASYLNDIAFIGDEVITKHSKNIIDLIEAGDIVNGFPVLEPVKNGNVWWGIDEGLENFKKSFGDIVTILTHEQYEQNCYRLEE